MARRRRRMAAVIWTGRAGEAAVPGQRAAGAGAGSLGNRKRDRMRPGHGSMTSIWNSSRAKNRHRARCRAGPRLNLGPARVGTRTRSGLPTLRAAITLGRLRGKVAAEMVGRTVIGRARTVGMTMILGVRAGTVGTLTLGAGGAAAAAVAADVAATEARFRVQATGLALTA